MKSARKRLAIVQFRRLLWCLQSVRKVVKRKVLRTTESPGML